jgi:hypothetical protein
MDDYQSVLREFYTAFKEGNSTQMTDFYHNEAIFEDPAFGILNSQEVKLMWKMLLSRSDSKLTVQFTDAKIEGNSGTLHWTADYIFSGTGRRVHNKIKATFEFKEGKIYRHKDDFDLYNWACQALGWPGYVWGWTPSFRNKLRKKTRKLLQKYAEKSARSL